MSLARATIPHMTILGNYPVDQQASMLRFAAIMTDGLTERGLSCQLLQPEPFFSRWARRPGGLAKWLGYVDKFIRFPRRLKRVLEARPASFVHICDHSNSLYVRHLVNVPHVVTCHDMIAVRQAAGELHGPPVAWTGRQLQQMIVRGLRAAHWVACDSESTRRDLQQSTARDSRTDVIHCQLNHPYRRVDRDQALRVLGEKWPQGKGARILHVGNNSWYKNRDGVIRIFAAARRLAPETAPELVVVGRECSPSQQAFLVREGLASVVHCVTGLTPQELEAAYSLADLFLFPSHYEGFGWPPIEAQACGCPVVAGSGGSLAEVLDGSALVAAATQEDQLVQHVVAVLRHEEVRALLRDRGLRNVARFQPPRMIDAYVNLYQRILTEQSAALPSMGSQIAIS